MRLTALTIKNFKGIDARGCRIEFSPITLLFGPNNAGKSTIIQALHLAQEILCRPDADLDRIDARGAGLNLGTFKDYVHAHDLNKKIMIELEMKVESLDLIKDFEDNSNLENISLREGGLSTIADIGLGLVIGWNYTNHKPLLEQYSVKLYSRVITTVKISYKEEGACFNVDLFDMSGFLHTKLIDSLEDDAQKIWDLVESNQNYSNELEELSIEAMDALAPVFRPFASHKKLLSAICGSEQLASSVVEEEKSLNFCVYGSNPASWQSWRSALIYFLGKYFEQYFDYEDENENYPITSLHIFENLLLSPLKWAEKILSQIFYIGPLRDIPARDSSRTQKITPSRWANGLAAWDVLATMKPEQLRLVNKMLNGEDSLNTGYKIQRNEIITLDLNSDKILVAKLKGLFKGDFDNSAIPLLREFLDRTPQLKLVLVNEVKGIQVQPYDMGAGISQLIPCIVGAIIARNGQLVAMEQPELHIHPAWQTTLADVFVRAIADKDNPPLFLLETHSEHLLLRLLKRIRQTNQETAPEGLKLKSGDLAIYWIGSHDNQTEIYPLEVDEEGSFTTPWPEGFFEERAEELFG